MTREDIGKQLCKLILAYWTPERIELWHEYEKNGPFYSLAGIRTRE